MFRLASELVGEGWNVVTTTTTKIRPERRSELTIIESDPSALLEQARAALKEHSHITLASGVLQAEGKLLGMEPTTVDELVSLPEMDAVMVEADGAKGRSLKAPAPHEPVIPSSTAILVPLAAVDVVGRPLDKSTVHRPERVAGLAGAELGETITPGHVSAVLLNPDGGLKNAPPRARVVPLINKVSRGSLGTAREIAQSLLESQRVQRVLLAAVAMENPVKEVWGRLAAIVLAAGGSTRFGSPKQLLPWRGKTLLEHTVDTVLESSADPVVVVLGHEAERIGAVLGKRPVETVINDAWASGQSSSVRAGLQALSEACDACLFVMADQPNLKSVLIDDVLDRYRRTLAPIVVPSHRGQRGSPVLFSRDLFPELLQICGDQGGRQVIERHEDEVETVEVSDRSLFLDIDTVEDYEGAR
jgi:molybdenum cofactor cytidylyltransferase